MSSPFSSIQFQSIRPASTSLSNSASSPQQSAEVIHCDADQVHLSMTTQAQSCQQCHQQTGCGAALIARLWPRRHYPLIISRDRFSQSVQVGDQLIVSVDQAWLQRAVGLLYALPLGGFLLGSVLGAWLGDTFFLQIAAEPASILGGLLGLGMGLVWAKRSTSQSARTQHLQIVQPLA